MASNYRNLVNKPTNNNNLASAVANNPLFKFKANPPVSNPNPLVVQSVQTANRVKNENPKPSGPVVIVNRSQESNPIFQHLNQTELRVLVKENTLPYHFCISPHIAILYLDAAYLQTPLNDLRAQFIALKKFDKPVVIVEKTSEFNDIQLEIVVRHGIALFPVSNEQEAAQCVFNLAKTKPNTNQKRKQPNEHKDDVIQTAKKIPTISQTRAQKIIERFGSLANISNADALQEVDKMGKQSAANVFGFFSAPFTDDI